MTWWGSTCGCRLWHCLLLFVIGLVSIPMHGSLLMGARVLSSTTRWNGMNSYSSTHRMIPAMSRRLRHLPPMHRFKCYSYLDGYEGNRRGVSDSINDEPNDMELIHVDSHDYDDDYDHERLDHIVDVSVEANNDNPFAQLLQGDDNDAYMAATSAMANDTDTNNNSEWQRMRDEKAKRNALKSSNRFESDEDVDSHHEAKPYEPEKPLFKKSFVVIGQFPSMKHLIKRDQAWEHHLQWSRRSALLPSSIAKVDWEYTILNENMSEPIAQVLGCHANDINHLQALFASEPFICCGGVDTWTAFASEILTHQNLTNDVYSPYFCLMSMSDGVKLDNTAIKAVSMSVAVRDQAHGVTLDNIPTVPLIDASNIVILPEKSFREHLQHHKSLAGRICGYHLLRRGDLIPSIDDKEIEEFVPLDNIEAENPPETLCGDETGFLIYFNARSNIDANRYLLADPVVSAMNPLMKLMGPMVMVDVNGLNLAMGTTFAEKAILDQIHGEDPEDLLRHSVEPLPGLNRLPIFTLPVEVMTDNFPTESGVGDVDEDGAKTVFLPSKGLINLRVVSHSRANEEALSWLKDNGISYGYDRLTIAKLFRSQRMEAVARRYNNEMEYFQQTIANVTDVDAFVRMLEEQDDRRQRGRKRRRDGSQ